MSTSADDPLLQELLDFDSLAEAESYALTSPALKKAFRDNKLIILQKHIDQQAWHDAVACVDTRLNGSKKVRMEFDQAYTDKTLAKPENESFWGLTDLCGLVKIIDKLIDRIDEAGHDPNHGPLDPPSSRDPGVFNTLDIWQDAWHGPSQQPAPQPHPLGDRCWLEKDQGTEDPENFRYAFARKANFYPPHNRPGYEGVEVDGLNRPKIQRAFFRLEFLRRAYYRRPLFPRGARWQCRNATLVHGEPQCNPGETPETRLARAEKVFAGWKREDFVEITCVFRATLNYYAVPLARMLDDFVQDAFEAVESEETHRVRDQLAREEADAWRDAEAVGLQWEHHPLFGGETGAMADIPLWDIPPDNEFLKMRGQLLDERDDRERWRRRRLVPLSRGEFDDVGCSVFRLPEIRGKRVHNADPSISLDEAHPELEMSKFLHLLASLPLRFLDKFMGMSERRQRRFLKTTFQAVARVKLSHAPSFLSGEVRAWSSKPADADGKKNWDRDQGERIFPELAVRSISLACLSRLYQMSVDNYFGWDILLSEDLNRPVWKWEAAELTPLSWAALRSKIKYKPYPINRLLGMSPESWRAVWRSDREIERMLWTGPGMDRERWEGYGHPGRLDPNECYCHFGQGCALCTPLPFVNVPEWKLFTAEEKLEEHAMDEYLRNYEMELEPRTWTSPPRTTIPVDVAAETFLRSLSVEYGWGSEANQ